jgi:hypothetical protein
MTWEELAAKIAAMKGMEPETPDIELELDLARNLFGRLDEEMRERVRAVAVNPTVETWQDAYSVIVGSDRWLTLWRAVLAVDPSFPRVGRSTDQQGNVVKEWARIPSQELLLRALRYATH